MVKECFLLYPLPPKDSLPSEKEMDFLLRRFCGMEQSFTLTVANSIMCLSVGSPSFSTLFTASSSWIPLPEKKIIFLSASVFKGAKPRY